MSSLHIRFAANSAKILVAGALLAASAAGCAVSGANAAGPWTTTTVPEAQFRCVSDCSAGGVGPVLNGNWVVTGEEPWHGPRGETIPPIGTWSRTVAIHCKEEISYQVEVRDTNWSGLWSVRKDWMANAIDNTSFPTCN